MLKVVKTVDRQGNFKSGYAIIDDAKNIATHILVKHK